MQSKVYEDKIYSKRETSIPLNDLEQEENHLIVINNNLKNSDDVREEWGGKLEFLLTQIGLAVGFGNVWRFPYLCYKNGGGAFLIPYFTMLIMVALPVYYQQMGFGQYGRSGILTIWKISPLFKGIGISSFVKEYIWWPQYVVVLAHFIFYLFASIKAIGSGLPWTNCENDWNTDCCIKSKKFTDEFFINKTNISYITNTTFNFNVTQQNCTKHFTSTQEYYNNFVLHKTKGIEEFGNMSWKLCLCLLFCIGVSFIIIIKGVKSIGKVSYVLSFFPFLILSVLLVRGLTLPGASIGMYYFLKPNFSKLLLPEVWIAATSQVMFSLGAVSCATITLPTFNNFKHNLTRDCIITTIINSFTSILAGSVIFSTLGYMSLKQNITIDKVATSGPGLAFEIFPEAISTVPIPILWSILFFLMMSILGLSTIVTGIESCCVAIFDHFPKYFNKNTKKKFILRLMVSFSWFILGLLCIGGNGIYVIELCDHYWGNFPYFIHGLVVTILLNYVYGYDNFANNMKTMLGHKPNIFWKICWKYISPIVFLIIIIFNIITYKAINIGENIYPLWAIMTGWITTIIIMSLIPVYFIYKFLHEGGYQLLKVLLKPEIEWNNKNLHTRKNQDGNYIDIIDNVIIQLKNKRY